MIWYYAITYIISMAVFGVWLYNDTLKDPKFKSKAKEISIIISCFWPAVVVILFASATLNVYKKVVNRVSGI